MTRSTNMRDFLKQLDKTGRQDPVHAARQAMRAPLTRRFFKTAETAAADNGFAVLLDGKAVRTPARRALILPTAAAAEIIANEFRSQESVIDPGQMPATRLVNTTIDGVVDDPQAIAEDIVKFAASDLICYRADAPHSLVRRQADAWDPLLDWVQGEFGANFVLAQGVMPVSQPREVIVAFATRLKMHDEPFRIACLHTMTSLTGSAILALAVAEGFIAVDVGWEAAHIDEDWNISQWGEDSEAAQRRGLRKLEMMAAANLLAALD